MAVDRPRRSAGPSLAALLNQERVFALALIAPLQFLLWFLLIIPTIIVLYLSLVNWQPIMGVDWWQAPFAWLGNYARVLQDRRFWEALLRTAGLVGVSVSLEFLLGLGLALLFRQDFRGKRLLTSVVLYPMMLPWVVVGLVFFLLFLDKGPVNYLIGRLLGADAPFDWYGHSISALGVIVLADVWQWTPFMFLILYSGLGALPKEPQEAALTLGASRWQVFRLVMLPLLRPIVFIAIVIRALEAFKIFDLVFIITRGGPGTATESLSLYLYLLSAVYGQLSYAAAMAVLVLVLVAMLTRVATKPLEQRAIR
ncbi:MAG TPA: sugar ABC transporter permease [bacterium]|jgi:multiple sugar transport system permease protein|nr:sugar ABC transporter permease [bacterium]